MINEALKLIRLFHKKTQRDTAKELGISVSYLSELEAGNRRINFDILEKYSKTFSIPPSSILFCGEHIRAGKLIKPTGGPLAKKMSKIMKWATGKEAKRTVTGEDFW